ncbi:hypothetical protein [Nitrososphaera sp.]|uniref:hypothetical protein n=1 Tax=Nitrososphaera sp. TaxID=1971748 RepID=UPI00307EEAA2
MVLDSLWTCVRVWTSPTDTALAVRVTISARRCDARACSFSSRIKSLVDSEL